MNLYLGIDFGTTGARSTVIDAAGTIYSETEYTFEGDRASQPRSIKRYIEFGKTAVVVGFPSPPSSLKVDRSPPNRPAQPP